MPYQNENNKFFYRNSKGKLVKIFIFLIKFIYNVFCIIKKYYIKFGNYSFSFKQTFSNPIFSTLYSKTPENASKKLIKFNND